MIGMIDDQMMPAARHLTGEFSHDILTPVVTASGAELLWSRPNSVQYRPGSDLVVRFRCGVRRGDTTSTETLLASTTIAGPPPGTVPIEARTPDGESLAVGVWKWPFDPTLAALADMLDSRVVANRLGTLVGTRPSFEVVAYRPTERAVIRISGPESTIYVKVVPAHATAGLVDRHEALGAAGLPVPRVVGCGTGWFAMEELAGPTMRDRIKADHELWPEPVAIGQMLDTLGQIELDTAPVRSRADDAIAHARMLRAVHPAETERLDRICEQLEIAVARSAERPRATIHGDLHEGQLVVDGRRLVGLLDIDDVGPGDPLDDRATMLAHLHFRSVSPTTDPAVAARLRRYGVRLRPTLTRGLDPTDVDLHLAAVLVGLATGPFRIQQSGWQATTSGLLDDVERLLSRR